MGELHGADENIDYGFTVPREEISKHFTNTGHSQGFVRHLVGEHGQGIAAFLFCFPDEGGRVGQIVPDPFVTVKQQTDDRPVRFAELFPVCGQIGHVAVRHVRMIDAGPALGLRFVRNGNRRVCKRRGVQPEVPKVFGAAVEGISSESCGNGFFYACSISGGGGFYCVDYIRDAVGVQKSAAFFPKF